MDAAGEAASDLSLDLTPADQAMLAYARKLTLTPRAVTAADVEALRAAGFDDAAILTIAQVVGFFNYYNRLSDGLGIDPEPEWVNGGGA